MSDGMSDGTPDLELEALLADDRVYSALEDLIADQRTRVAYREKTSGRAAARARREEHLLSVARRGLDMLLNLKARACDLAFERTLEVRESPPPGRPSSGELPDPGDSEDPRTAVAPGTAIAEAEGSDLTSGNGPTSHGPVDSFEPDRADAGSSGVAATRSAASITAPEAPNHVLHAGRPIYAARPAARPGNAAGARVDAQTADAGWRGEGGRNGDASGPGSAAILPALTADVPLRYRVAGVLAAAGEPLTVRAVVDALAARGLAPGGRGEHAKRSVRRAMSDASDLVFRRGPEDTWMLLTPVRPARDPESTAQRDEDAVGSADPGGTVSTRVAANRVAV